MTKNGVTFAPLIIKCSSNSFFQAKIKKIKNKKKSTGSRFFIIKSSQFHLCSPISQIKICLRRLLKSVQHGTAPVLRLSVQGEKNSGKTLWGKKHEILCGCAAFICLTWQKNSCSLLIVLLWYGLDSFKVLQKCYHLRLTQRWDQHFKLPSDWLKEVLRKYKGQTKGKVEVSRGTACPQLYCVPLCVLNWYRKSTILLFDRVYKTETRLEGKNNNRKWLIIHLISDAATIPPAGCQWGDDW